MASALFEVNIGREYGQIDLPLLLWPQKRKKVKTEISQGDSLLMADH